MESYNETDIRDGGRDEPVREKRRVDAFQGQAVTKHRPRVDRLQVNEAMEHLLIATETPSSSWFWDAV